MDLLDVISDSEVQDPLGSNSDKVQDPDGRCMHASDNSNPAGTNAIKEKGVATRDTVVPYDVSLYEKGIGSMPLYSGATVTLLQAVVQQLSWFTSHPSVSKEALSGILSVQHSILPSDNLLPDSYDKAIQIVSKYLLQPIVYHACPNDCILFRGEYADLCECPTCHSKRYMRAGSTEPVRRFIYLPIGPRLVRLFGTPNLSEMVQSHQGGTSKEEIWDIHDSEAWNKEYSPNGQFQGDSRGISLALCTDGVCPFSGNRITYSMWPIVLTVLNFPRKIRMLFGNMWLAGIVPGSGTKEPQSLSPYLEVIADEIISLNGTQIFDSYRYEWL